PSAINELIFLIEKWKQNLISLEIWIEYEVMIIRELMATLFDLINSLPKLKRFAGDLGEQHQLGMMARLEQFNYNYVENGIDMFNLLKMYSAGNQALKMGVGDRLTQAECEQLKALDDDTAARITHLCD